MKLNFNFERKNIGQKVLIFWWPVGFLAGLVPVELVIITFEIGLLCVQNMLTRVYPKKPSKKLVLKTIFCAISLK